MSYRAAAGAAFAALVLAGAPAVAQSKTSGADVIKALNKDTDNTLEIAEIIDAGVKTFQAINPDGDTTLESGETKGRITDEDWKTVNKDGDETLEMDEWLQILRARFAKANPDNDGSLDAAELDTPAGQDVVKMIVK